MPIKSAYISRQSEHDDARGGAIELSFFNLFWIFIIACVAGLLGETIVSFFRDGHWESRAGLVFGPLSPIYGVGALLITIALNRLHDRNPLVLFLIAGVVGAGFEYFAGWFWETSFGIVAWSYEGQPFNFHGRTSLAMACVWGLCGVLWMKFGLPVVMKLVDRIPRHVRTQVTIVCATLLFIDVFLTFASIDCWFLRMSGAPIETPIQEFCAHYFNDQFMKARFETMSMWTSLASR